MFQYYVINAFRYCYYPVLLKTEWPISLEEKEQEFIDQYNIPTYNGVIYESLLVREFLRGDYKGFHYDDPTFLDAIEKLDNNLDLLLIGELKDYELKPVVFFFFLAWLNEQPGFRVIPCQAVQIGQIVDQEY